MANGNSTITWAKRNLGVIREDGSAIVRVRLLAVDQCWQTWYPDTWEAGAGEDRDRKLEDWAVECDNLIAALQNEWPKRTISVQIVAENQQLEVVAQALKTVQGANKDANAKSFASESQALAMSFDAQARTMERILACSAAQLEASNRMCANIMAQNQTLMTVMLRDKEDQLQTAIERAEAGPDATTTAFQQQLSSQLPALIELGMHWLKHQTVPGAN